MAKRARSYERQTIEESSEMIGTLRAKLEAEKTKRVNADGTIEELRREIVRISGLWGETETLRAEALRKADDNARANAGTRENLLSAVGSAERVACLLQSLGLDLAEIADHLARSGRKLDAFAWANAGFRVAQARTFLEDAAKAARRRQAEAESTPTTIKITGGEITFPGTPNRLEGAGR